MYYLGKLIQAAGLTIVLIDFVLKFPRLMSRTTLVAGVLLFTFGWIIQRFLSKGRSS